MLVEVMMAIQKILFKFRFKFNRLQWFVHISSVVPLFVLFFDGFTNQLTANPIQEITQRTGRIAIIWLLFSLTCTPLNNIFGLTPFSQVRRPLGLYSAFYSVLHASTYFILDYGLNFQLILKDILEKPFLVLGLLGFIFILVLAFTSTKKSMKKLGKKWITIHKLVYPAAIILVFHFILALKFINSLAITISLFLFALLLVRLPLVRKLFKQRRPSWISNVNTFITGRKRKTIVITK